MVKSYLGKLGVPERLPRGLRRRSRKAVLPKGDVGSNPTLSANDTKVEVKVKVEGVVWG